MSIGINALLTSKGTGGMPSRGNEGVGAEMGDTGEGDTGGEGANNEEPDDGVDEDEQEVEDDGDLDAL